MNSVSVLVAMPLYNGGRYLAAAIDSILSQTYRDFGFLIVNDGSTDGGDDIVKSYHDPRLTLIEQENRGAAAAMNRAIQFAAAHDIPYVARADADDISLPRRLEVQLGLLLADSKIAACSANCQYIDQTTAEVIGTSLVPHTPWLIRWEIQQGLRGLIQPATMFRTEMLNEVGGYREQFWNAEDTDVFLRLCERYRLANSSRYLCQIRLRDESLSLKDVRQNRLYHLYALDCHKRRKKQQPEKSFAEFAQANHVATQFALWRDVAVLDLWRKGMRTRSVLPVLLACLLDPRRPIAHVARRVF